MRSAILLLALAACQTTKEVKPSSALPALVSEHKDNSVEIQKLKEDVRQLRYFIDHDKCFISYAVCLSEKKKESKTCWDVHEACVIAVYSQYKGIN